MSFLLSVFCAIVSHPADTVVSYMNKAKGSTISSAAKALGFKGLWGGLGPRIIMIGTLTALQWFIYDSVKVRRHWQFSSFVLTLWHKNDGTCQQQNSKKNVREN